MFWSRRNKSQTADQLQNGGQPVNGKGPTFTPVSQAVQRLLSLRQRARERIDTFLGEMDERLEPSLAALNEWINTNPVLRDNQNAIARLQQLAASVDVLRSELDAAVRRIRGDRFTVAVVGYARMGKSTFLQSLTGLDDSVLPTGDRLVVTGTRAQITNIPADDPPSADVDYHDETSLLQQVIIPYCNTLGIRRPTNLSDFLDTDLDAVKPSGADATNERLGFWTQLKGLQEAVSRYRTHLGRAGHAISLRDVPKYVSKERSLLWAVVRQVTVHCSMPMLGNAPVRIVDTAGLGELAPQHREQLLETIGKTANLVIVIRMPKEKGDFWHQADAALMDLVESRINEVSADTPVVTVINETPGNRHLLDSFVENIRKHTEGRVWIERLNCANSQEVQACVAALIERVASDGKGMGVDLNALASSLEQNASQARSVLKEIQALVSSAQPSKTDLIERVERLMDGLTEALDHLQDALTAVQGLEDEQVCEEAFALVQGLANPVLREIPDAETIEKGIRRAKGHGPALVKYLNELRTHLAACLHNILSDRIKEKLNDARLLALRALRKVPEIATALAALRPESPELLLDELCQRLARQVRFMADDGELVLEEATCQLKVRLRELLRAMPELEDALRKAGQDEAAPFEALATDLQAAGATEIGAALMRFARRQPDVPDIFFRVRPVLEALSATYECRRPDFQPNEPTKRSITLEQRILDSLQDHTIANLPLDRRARAEAECICRALEAQVHLTLRLVENRLRELLKEDVRWLIHVWVEDLVDALVRRKDALPEWMSWCKKRASILWADQFLDVTMLSNLTQTVDDALDRVVAFAGQLRTL